MFIGGTASAHIAAYQARKAYSEASVININSAYNGAPATRRAVPPNTDTVTVGTASAASETAIGGWGEAASSATVLRPAKFDPSAPVYKVLIWGPDGRQTTRRIEIADVDPKAADEIEMLALSSHASESGALPAARTVFMGARAYARTSRGMDTASSPTDWLDIVDGAMQSRYADGDIQGFMDCKAYWDMLSEI